MKDVHMSIKICLALLCNVDTERESNTNHLARSFICMMGTWLRPGPKSGNLSRGMDQDAYHKNNKTLG